MSIRGRLLAATSLSALLCAVGCDALSGEPTPGDDVLLGDTAYGWATSQDIGTRFSNGLTVVPIGKGPLTIEKIEPVIEGEALHLLGVKARVLPTTVDEGPYQLMTGWPPSPIEPGDDVYVRGLTEPAGLEVPVPNVEPDGRQPNLHIVVGYDMTGEGRAVQRGIWVTYRFDGDSERVFLGSYLAVCAPKTVTCRQEDEDGPVPA